MLVKALCFFALSALLFTSTTQAKRVMPWFCLERCDANSTEIAWELNEIQNNLAFFSAASFELYNLGPNGTLVNNNATLTPVAARLASMGLKTYPMISSYPYPPAFLDWMRQLWDPKSNYGDAFINATIQNAILFGHTGYNVDWEPTGNATAQDGMNYAAFLDKMARALHQYNIEVTVDIASWSPIWNLTALNLTAVDKIITMDTYTAKWDSFQSHLIKNVNYISLNKLGIGLSTLNLTNGSTVLPPEDMMNRFAMVLQYGIQEIDIWQMPIPSFWMPLLGQFLKQSADEEVIAESVFEPSLEMMKQLRGDLEILSQAQTTTGPRRGHITRQKIAANLI